VPGDASSPAGTPSLPSGTASSPARARPVAAGNAADTARNLADAAGSGVCVDGKRAFAVPKAASCAGNGACGGGKAVVAGPRVGFPARPTPHTRITKAGAAMRRALGWSDPARSCPSDFTAEDAESVENPGVSSVALTAWTRFFLPPSYFPMISANSIWSSATSSGSMKA
jgi:hypothetical protein